MLTPLLKTNVLGAQESLKRLESAAVLRLNPLNKAQLRTHRLTESL